MERSLQIQSGFSLVELLITLTVISLTFFCAAKLYRSTKLLKLRSTANEVTRFIRTNESLTFLSQQQTDITIDRASGKLTVTAGAALNAPAPGFSQLTILHPVVIDSAAFGDLNTAIVELNLRPAGSVTPGHIGLSLPGTELGCSLIMGLRGSLQTICD